MLARVLHWLWCCLHRCPEPKEDDEYEQALNRYLTIQARVERLRIEGDVLTRRQRRDDAD